MNHPRGSNRLKHEEQLTQRSQVDKNRWVRECGSRQVDQHVESRKV